MPAKRRRGRVYQSMRKTAPTSCDQCQARIVYVTMTATGNRVPEAEGRTRPHPVRRTGAQAMKRIDRDNLPVPVEEMGLHRKTALTPMVMVDGPFTVVTQEGDYALPDGWRGFVAVDRAGFPYPIALDEYHQTYEPVGDMRVPLI